MVFNSDWGISNGCFFFSSRRRHTRYWRDWSSDVYSSDLSLLRLSQRAPVLFFGPTLEGVPTYLRVITAQGGYVRAVTYLVEPLEHPRSVLPHRLAHLLEWQLGVVNLVSCDSRQDLRHFLKIGRASCRERV